jgi:hypothetical protein
MPSSNKVNKIQDLCDVYGFDDAHDLMEAYQDDSIIPGICMNEGCDATYEYEPDSSDGYCDVCGANTVQSIMVLTGVI